MGPYDLLAGPQDPQQRQMMMAEILRKKQEGEQNDQLQRAFANSRKHDMLPIVGAMSQNPEVAAASKMAAENQRSYAPKAMGNQGFMLPDSGEFVASPIFTEERRAAREAASDARRDTLGARADQALSQRSLQETLAVMMEQGRNDRAGAERALRLTLEGMRDDRERDRINNKPPKPLDRNVNKELNKLESDAGLAESLSSSFKPEFSKPAIKAPIVGGMLVNAQNAMGRSGMSEGYADQANWWQNYASWVNTVRHSLFGSALTATEKAAFEKAVVTEGMDPKLIKARLQQQHSLAARAYNKIKAGYTRGGHDLTDFPDLSEPAAPVPGGVNKPNLPLPAAAAQRLPTAEELGLPPGTRVIGVAP